MQNLISQETISPLNLNAFIQQLLMSDEINIFKIIYLKNCSSKKEWYEQICRYVSGLRINSTRSYNISVITQTYSSKNAGCIKKEYSFSNIKGFDIVDCCFKNIDECKTCNVLAIKMEFADEMGSWILDKEQNNCYYFFIRENSFKKGLFSK